MSTDDAAELTYRNFLCNVIGHGGGWGYSAHSVEAIRFCSDADILLGGLGLFGGRGEYTAKLKVSGRDTSKWTKFPLALFARSIHV